MSWYTPLLDGEFAGTYTRSEYRERLSVTISASKSSGTPSISKFGYDVNEPIGITRTG